MTDLRISVLRPVRGIEEDIVPVKNGDWHQRRAGRTTLVIRPAQVSPCW